MWSNCILGLVLLVGSVSCFSKERIVNGTDADIEEFPYLVSIRYDSEHLCAGTIIAPNWILTASHCLRGVVLNRLSVQYGVTEVSRYSQMVTSVKRFIMHESYNQYMSHANDVALIELVEKFSYNYVNIAPVQLPEPYFEIPQLPEGVPGVLPGWGLNATGGLPQTHLQQVDLKIYNHTDCYKRHHGDITATQICGGIDEGGKGQCNGDSGGPLIFENRVQLGIVSWSIKPCARYPYPGVFTKVSHFVNWIRRFVDV